MRYFFFLPALLALSATNAHARAFDSKELARYDASYVKCEAQHTDMRGRRDEAYLKLWRIKDDKKAATRLESVRKSAAYQAERTKVLQSKSHNAAKLKQQCLGLRGELQRNKQSRN